MKRNWKGMCSILLTVFMIFSLLPVKPALATVGTGTDITADFVDTNFLSAVRERLGKEPGDEIYDSDVANIGSLDVSSRNITSLAGIEYFTSLEYLVCRDNQLEVLDISGLTKLRQLSCDNNQLVTIDVSGLSSLEYLSCSSNSLTQLKMDGAYALESISCGDNQLSSLDVSSLNSLKHLSCRNSQLTTLNISGLNSLEDLYCPENQLVSLDASNLTALTFLDCDDNQLTTLNINSTSVLEVLSCNNNQLSALDVSDLISLKNLSFCYNKITGIELDGLSSLERLYCPNNQLGSLDVSNLTALISLVCDDNQLTSLDVSGLALLKDLSCNNNQLTSLNIDGANALETLTCSENQLISLDVSNLTALTTLFCSDNQLTSLDVSGLAFLEKLLCGDNQLTSLDVSGLAFLEKLMCDENQLTSLNINGANALESLYCSENQLITLAAIDLTALKELYCPNNQLESLNISGSNALESLICRNNRLTALNVTGLNVLVTLNCFYNNFSGISSIVGYDSQRTTDFHFDPQNNPSTDTAVATLTINKDGILWSNHGKNFILKSQENKSDTVPMTNVGGTATATVRNGVWKVYDGNVDTGTRIIISNGDGNAELNYYTIQYSVEDAGMAEGSTINATYNDNPVVSGTIVPGGGELIITAAGAGANTYTYFWSGMGADVNTHTIPTIFYNLSSTIHITCTITGSTSNNSPGDITDEPTAHKEQILPNVNEVSMPSVGNVKALVFLVEFPDSENQNKNDNITAQSVKDLLFNTDNTDNYPYESATNYYLRSSYGKLSITGDVYGYYTAQKSRSEYSNGEDDESNYLGRQELLNEVMTYYDSEIDYSQYDSDKDGTIDAVYINFAGDNTGYGSEWWSYMTSWMGTNLSPEFDGKKINDFVWLHQPAYTGDGINQLYDITFIHETGHLLGLADYYDADYDGWDTDGLKSYDMMETNVGDNNSFSKYLLGWIKDPQIITSNEKVSLKPYTEYPDMAIVYPKGDTASKQFFVLEYVTDTLNNRQWPYTGLLYGGAGIRIWRVNTTLNEDETGYKYDNHTGDIEDLEFISSSGSKTLQAVEYAPHMDVFYEGEELTPYSTPSSYIYGEGAAKSGPWDFSGVTVNQIHLGGDTATAQVTFETSPAYSEFEIKGALSCDNVMNFTITSGVEMRYSSAEPQAEIYSGENKIAKIDLKQFAVTGVDYDKVYGYAMEDAIGINSYEGQELSFVIPEGTFTSSYGVYSKELKINFTPRSNSAVTIGEISNNAGNIQQYYQVGDDLFACFRRNWNGTSTNLYDLLLIHTDTNQIEDIPVNVTYDFANDLNGKYPIEAYQLSDNTFAVYTYYAGNIYMDKVDYTGKVLASKVVDLRSMGMMGIHSPIYGDYVFEDGFIMVVDITTSESEYIYFDNDLKNAPMKLSIQDMMNTTIPTTGGWVLQDIGNGQKIIIQNEGSILYGFSRAMCVITDKRMSVIKYKELSSMYGNYNRAYKDAFRLDDDRIGMISVVKKSDTLTDWIMEIYDNDLNLISSQTLLADTTLEYKHFMQTASGYVISAQGWKSYGEVLHGGMASGIYYGRFTKAIFFDKEFQLKNTYSITYPDKSSVSERIGIFELNENEYFIGDWCACYKLYNTITTNEATLQSIAITTPASKLTYTVGDSLDISGMVVTGTYSDSSTKAETVTTSNVTGFDSSAPTASQMLTVTVGGKTVTYTVTIKAAPAEKSSDADLSELSLGGASLSPAFSSGTTSYTASVANSVNSITVTTRANDSKASVKVNGNSFTGGQMAVELNAGNNTITIEITAENATVKTYTIIVIRAAAGNNGDGSGNSNNNGNGGGSPVVPYTGTESSSTETITTEVKGDSSDSTVSRITIERTTGADGKKTDTVTFAADKAAETVQKLKEVNSDTARIVLPDTKGEVEETKVNIPSTSIGTLSDANINLQISTDAAKIDLSSEALTDISSGTEEDLYFRLVPVKDEAGKKTVNDQAVLKASIVSGNAESNVSVIGNPITIETNMSFIAADITLPLTGITIPSNPAERTELLQQLAVYIEHSDGDKELVQGELIEYGDGIYGIKFHITKFSTFTVVKTDAFLKSPDNSIIRVTAPNEATIKGTNITATVANTVSSITVKLTAGDKAVWNLYSDKAATKAVEGKKLILKTGINTAYIKVTAEDGTAKVYKLTITRSKSSAAVVTKVGVPKATVIKGKTITSTVAGTTASLTVKISVSSKATWKLYRDKACKKVVADKKLTLKNGTNTVYIKVTAEDGKSSNVYTLKITRKAVTKK